MEGVKDVPSGAVSSSTPGLHGGRDEHAGGCPSVRSAPGYSAQDAGLLSLRATASRALPSAPSWTRQRAMRLGQWQPFEVAIQDQGMEVVLNLTRDGGRVDMETEFYVSLQRCLGEVGRGHQSFTPIDYHALRVQRAAHRPHWR